MAASLLQECLGSSLISRSGSAAVAKQHWLSSNHLKKKKKKIRSFRALLDICPAVTDFSTPFNPMFLGIIMDVDFGGCGWMDGWMECKSKLFFNQNTIEK